MTSNKIKAHIAKHLPTGANVPVVVGKVDDKNVIQEYKEHLEHRRGFSLVMLQNRWDMCRDEVLDMLTKFQVPAHVNHQEVMKLKEGMLPVDVAIFFEEYIYGVEKKSKISHNKLKSKPVEIAKPN